MKKHLLIVVLFLFIFSTASMAQPPATPKAPNIPTPAGPPSFAINNQASQAPTIPSNTSRQIYGPPQNVFNASAGNVSGSPQNVLAQQRMAQQQSASAVNNVYGPPQNISGPPQNFAADQQRMTQQQQQTASAAKSVYGPPQILSGPPQNFAADQQRLAQQQQQQAASSSPNVSGPPQKIAGPPQEVLNPPRNTSAPQQPQIPQQPMALRVIDGWTQSYNARQMSRQSMGLS